MTDALPVADAAAALGVSAVTVRRWISAGCPTARRGRRGRGCRTLLDLEAVRAWRAAQAADAAVTNDVLRDLAARVPEAVAEAAAEAFQAAPDKRGAAWACCVTWALVIGAIYDAMRKHLPDLQDPSVIPEPIEHLRKIARQ